jgi:hypothetical protein
MRPLWPEVLEALGQLAGSIPDDDVLEVRLFDEGVRTLIPATAASASARSGWQARLRALPMPSGQHTDLGRTAESVVRSLTAAPPGGIQFVFVLTDGQHDPGAGSAYSGVEATSALGKLEEEVRSIGRARNLAITMIRLTAMADRALLTKVFPDAVVVDATGAGELRSWFATTAREVSVRKLRALLDAEMRAPASRLASKEAIHTRSDQFIDAEATLEPMRRVLVTRLADSSAVALPGGGRLEPSQSLLEPSIEVRVRIAGSPQPWWKRPATSSRTVSGSVPIWVTLEPADELQRLGLSPERRRDSVAIDLALMEGGLLPPIAYYPALIGLLLSLLGAAVLAKWALHKPAIEGEFRIGRTDTDDAALQSWTQAAGGARSVRIMDPCSPERVLAEVHARKRRGTTFIECTPSPDTPLKYRGKVASGPFEIPVNARLEAGEYAIQYRRTTAR